MKKGFNIAMSKPAVLFIFYTDAVFVFSASDTFCVESKGLNSFCILTRRIQTNNRISKEIGIEV